MDKNQAILTFLQSYTSISTNPLFFNFGTVENNAHQIISGSNDVNLQDPYIDGSVLKMYTITIDTFKSVTAIPIVVNNSAENVDDLKDVQDLMDWVNTQNDLKNYPNFGDTCIVEEMKTSTENPKLLGIEESVTPPLAVYRVTIQVKYLDTSKRLWS